VGSVPRIRDLDQNIVYWLLLIDTYRSLYISLKNCGVLRQLQIEFNASVISHHLGGQNSKISIFLPFEHH
jgi:hypothetical protein